MIRRALLLAALAALYVFILLRIAAAFGTPTALLVNALWFLPEANRRITSWHRAHTARRLEARMVAQAAAALAAHARGDRAAYLQFANAARASRAAVRALQTS